MIRQDHTFCRPLTGTLCIAVALLLIRCANPIPPTGGPKDVTAPELIPDASTPNLLTNFDRKEIVLTFDEWVELKDPGQQIVISPPLVNRPEIKVKGKSVLVILNKDEVLRPNTTYTINFGESIQNLTERIAADQFQYIFSTGPFIDSLSISGSLFNAASGEPAKGALILLNENLTDTAFEKTIPTYFTKVDDKGNWKLEHLRGDTFQIYALQDANFNYKYDQVGESIGFTGEWIILPDTQLAPIRMKLFTEDETPAVVDVNRRTSGITKVTMTTAGNALHFVPIDSSVTLTWQQTLDTLFLWHAGTDTLEVAIAEGMVRLDTLKIFPYTGNGAPAFNVRAAARTVHPAQPLRLVATTPIATISEDTLAAFLNDTIPVQNLTLSRDTTDSRMVLLNGRWQEKGRYTVTFPAGIFTDPYGAVNDTLEVTFQAGSAGNFGQIFLTVEGLSDSLSYVIQLTQQNLTPVDAFVLSGVSSGKGTFSALAPQNYLIRIVEDRNGNGRWDTGMFAEQRQPERIQIEKLEPVRAGWDLEATVTWKPQN